MPTRAFLEDLADVQAHSPRGLQDFLVDVKAGRLLATHSAACPHMALCASQYLKPSKGKLEAVAHILHLKALMVRADI